MATPARDLTGQRFGMLKAVRRVPRPADGVKTQCSFWECKCDCGKTVVIPKSYLLSDKAAKNCGCVRAAKSAARKDKEARKPRPAPRWLNPKLSQNQQAGLKELGGVEVTCPVCKRPFELLSKDWAYRRSKTTTSKGKDGSTRWYTSQVYYCSWHCLRAGNKNDRESEITRR